MLLAERAGAVLGRGQVHEEGEGGARDHHVVVLDGGQDVAHTALDAHNAKSGRRVAGRLDRARGLVRRQLGNEVVGGVAVLLGKSGCQLPHRDAERVALAGDRVHAVEVRLDVPVRVHVAQERRAPEVRALLVVGEQGDLFGGQRDVQIPAAAITVLLERDERLAVELRVPAVESQGQARGELAEPDARAVHRPDVLVRRAPEVEHQKGVAHHVVPVLGRPGAGRGAEFEPAKEIVPNEGGDLLGLGFRGSTSARRRNSHAVILSPSLVILSEAKNLCISLRRSFASLRMGGRVLRHDLPLGRLDGQLAGGERGPDLRVAAAHSFVSGKRAAARELGVIFAEVVQEAGGDRGAADPERGLKLAARHRARGQGPVARGRGGNGHDGRSLQGRARAVRLRPHAGDRGSGFGARGSGFAESRILTPESCFSLGQGQHAVQPVRQLFGAAQLAIEQLRLVSVA